jgi:hypothetical protein
LLLELSDDRHRFDPGTRDEIASRRRATANAAASVRAGRVSPAVQSQRTLGKSKSKRHHAEEEKKKKKKQKKRTARRPAREDILGNLLNVFQWVREIEERGQSVFLRR